MFRNIVKLRFLARTFKGLLRIRKKLKKTTLSDCFWKSMSLLYNYFLFRIIGNTMRMIIAIFTVSLVVCLALSSNEDEIEVDQDELLDEIFDREKRDAIPQPRGTFLSIYLIFVFCLATKIWIYSRICGFEIKRKKTIKHILSLSAELCKIYMRQKPL